MNSIIIYESIGNIDRNCSGLTRAYLLVEIHGTDSRLHIIDNNTDNQLYSSMCSLKYALDLATALDNADIAIADNTACSMINSTLQRCIRDSREAYTSKTPGRLARKMEEIINILLFRYTNSMNTKIKTSSDKHISRIKNVISAIDV